MKNKYEIRGEATVIFLKRKDGTILESIIDTIDLEKVGQITNTWFASWDKSTNSFTARCNITKGNKRTTIYLHQWIFEFKNGIQADFINHDTLDSRRSNIRKVTPLQNNQNRKGAYKNSKSGVRGVSWDKKKNKWRVIVCVNYKPIHLGRFEDLEEAERVAIEARSKYMPYSQEAKTA